MIRLDLTSHAVTVEGDEDLDQFITVRTLQTENSASIVARMPDADLLNWVAPRGGVRLSNLPLNMLEETARARSGQSVMREYDINDPGVYSLTSGRREMQQSRTFFMALEFVDKETMQITVLPGSAECPWVVDDELHNYQARETFRFNVRVTHAGVGLAEGEITRIESDQTGVKFDRATAWARILEDDDADSV